MEQSRKDAELHLDLLLKDYEQAREADRQDGAAMTTIMGAALASCLAVLGFLSGYQGQPIGDSFIYWVIILAPVALLLPTGYATMMGANKAVRSYYLRVLESQIGNEMNKLCGGVELSYSEELNFPAFSSTYFEVVRSAPKSGRGIARLFAFFVVLVFAGANICLLKIAYSALLQVNNGFVANLYFVLYMIVVLSMGTLAYQTGINGRSFFEQTVKDVNKRYFGGFGSKGSQYEIYKAQLEKAKGNIVSVKNTLKLFPKADDLTKILVDMIGAILAGLTLYINLGIGVDGIQFAHISLAILFFEGFVYQTRYILNDVLGASEERGQKSVDIRGRIVQEEDVFLAARHLFFRLVIILAAIVLACKLGLMVIYMKSLIGLMFITVLYELCRYLLGRSKDGSLLQHLYTVAMFPLVSLGMVLRLWVSFTVYCAVVTGGLDSVSNWCTFIITDMTSGGETLGVFILLIYLLVWGVLFGIVTVSLTWVVEALYEVNRCGAASISADWKVPGKLHVLASLRLLFWVFGVRVMRNHQPGDRVMENGLSPQQGLAELIADKSFSIPSWFRRYLRMVVTPWTWGSVIGMVLSVEIASGVCAVNMSNWVSVLVFIVSLPLVLCVEDLLMIKQKVNGILVIVLILLQPIVISLLLCVLYFTAWIAVSEHGTLSGYVVLSFILMFYGGPMSFMYLRTTYAETRNVLVNTVAFISNIDKQFALAVTNAVIKPKSTPKLRRGD
jgi:membrane protein|nr:hypothetical protein [uncultured Actinomyces sp.]